MGRLLVNLRLAGSRGGLGEGPSAGPQEGQGARIGARDLPQTFRSGTSDYSSFGVFCGLVRGFSRGPGLGRTLPADTMALSPRGETQPGRWGGAAAWTHCHALTPERGHAWRGARRGVPSPLAPLPCETPGAKLSFKKLTNFEKPGEPTA